MEGSIFTLIGVLILILGRCRIGKKSFVRQDLLFYTVPCMDVTFREHKRHLRSSFCAGFFFEFLKEFTYNQWLFMGAVVRHTSHWDCDLFCAAKSYWSMFVLFWSTSELKLISFIYLKMFSTTCEATLKIMDVLYRIRYC